MGSVHRREEKRRAREERRAAKAAARAAKGSGSEDDGDGDASGGGDGNGGGSGSDTDDSGTPRRKPMLPGALESLDDADAMPDGGAAYVHTAARVSACGRAWQAQQLTPVPDVAHR